MNRALVLAVVVGVLRGALGQHLPLPPLPYDYDALEPYIDGATMRVHHLGHHATYTQKLNEVLTSLRADEHTKPLVKAGIDSMLARLDGVSVWGMR